ncbi:MAG: hypothetical protein M1816_002218 [Peltula sp. TS41687]|nr:MAG: hypothetical protein M1816_002218 [Peltula sp. TS41687]
MSRQQDVEFKTIDGLLLRGRLFSAGERGPGIVMTPGINSVKEMLGLLDVARHFQEAGITALVYDPRSTGLSDGIPRNEIDPARQVEDYSDALTFLAGTPTVDRTRMAIWGYSLSGTIALCAAALDKRAKLVIAVTPPTNFRDFATNSRELTPSPKLPKLLAKVIKDRESQLKGNAPFMVPLIDVNGESLLGQDFGIIDKKTWATHYRAGTRLGPNHVNRTTLQTYYKQLLWYPQPLLRLIDPTPVLFVLSELEHSDMLEDQVHTFESLSAPKRLHIEPGVYHMNILEGAHLPGLMKVQTDFTHDALKGRIQKADRASTAEQGGTLVTGAD